jgi:phenylalanine-4-hydroxylase
MLLLLPSLLPLLVLLLLCSGTPIPRVEYTPAEIATWGTALSKLKAMYPQYACKEFNTAMSKLSFKEDKVPQLQDISESLKAATGWQVGFKQDFCGA